MKNVHSKEREAKILRERLDYIGRYQSDISSKLPLWQKLEDEKKEIRVKLRALDTPNVERKPFTKRRRPAGVPKHVTY